MPGPQPSAVKLTDTERKGLEKLDKAHNTEQQMALRARIVLAFDDGLNNTQVARKLHASIDTVREWRKRWLALQATPLSELSVEERLQDLPRCGAPSRISADQLCQIVALACEPPEQSGRPITHWTSREVADEIMKRGLVEHISPRHAARLLKRGICSRT